MGILRISSVSDDDPDPSGFRPVFDKISLENLLEKKKKRKAYTGASILD